MSCSRSSRFDSHVLTQITNSQTLQEYHFLFLRNPINRKFITFCAPMSLLSKLLQRIFFVETLASWSDSSNDFLWLDGERAACWLASRRRERASGDSRQQRHYLMFIWSWWTSVGNTSVCDLSVCVRRYHTNQNLRGSSSFVAGFTVCMAPAEKRFSLNVQRLTSFPRIMRKITNEILLKFLLNRAFTHRQRT